MDCVFTPTETGRVCLVCGRPTASRDGPRTCLSTLEQVKAVPFPFATRPPIRGPGDVLHRLIIRRFGEDYRTGCGCESFVAEMNHNGPAWCREHAGEIAAKMQTEAEKRGWKLAKLRWPTKRFCRLLVLKAIRDAEKAQR